MTVVAARLCREMPHGCSAIVGVAVIISASETLLSTLQPPELTTQVPGALSNMASMARRSLDECLKSKKTKHFVGEARALACLALAIVQVIDRYARGDRSFHCTAACFDVLPDAAAAAWSRRAEACFPAHFRRDQDLQPRARRGSDPWKPGGEDGNGAGDAACDTSSAACASGAVRPSQDRRRTRPGG